MSGNGKRSDIAVWFEIPAADFDRANGFYEEIFATRLVRNDFDGRRMGVFPNERQEVGGCILEDPDHQSGGSGTVVYLNCDGQLDDVAGRVVPAGGQVLTPRIDLPGEMGSLYHISDSEGNRVGLHAVA